MEGADYLMFGSRYLASAACRVFQKFCDLRLVFRVFEICCMGFISRLGNIGLISASADNFPDPNLLLNSRPNAGI